MANDAAEYYENLARAADARGNTSLAKYYRQKSSGGVEQIPEIVGVPPTTGTATKVSAPPFAYSGVVVPPQKDVQPAIGRERDILGDIRSTEDDLADLENRLVEFHIFENNLSEEEARKLARTELLKHIESLRFNVAGERETSNIESMLAPIRESRLYTRQEIGADGKQREVHYYWDPELQDWRPPTDSEYVTEAFAKQELMSPEKIARQMQQIRKRAYDTTLAYNIDVTDPEFKDVFTEQYRRDVTEAFDELFMYTRPGHARTIESVVGANLRSWPAIVNTAVNTMLFNYTPYVWEMDPETGKPVDPDSWSYRIHQGMIDLLTETGGMSEEEAKELLTGEVKNPLVGVWNTFNPASGPAKRLEEKFGPQISEGYQAVLGEDVGGVAGDLTRLAMNPPEGLIPIPFQPTLRGHATSVDPYGVRVASTTGDFWVDYGLALARGRSLGDEMMSMPALREDRVEGWYRSQKGYKENSKAGENTVYKHMGTTAPYWYGVMTEMAYGVGPFTGLKHAVRTGAKGLDKFADTIGSSTLAKAAFVAGHPVKAAELSRARRIAGDMIEKDKLSGDLQKELFEAQLDANGVRRVAGEVGGREVGTPYAVQAYLESGGRDGATIVSVIEGSEIGPYLLKRAFPGQPPAGVGGRTLSEPEAKELIRVIYQWRAEAFRPGVMQIAGVNNPNWNDATRIARIQEYLNQGGVTQKVLPELGNKEKLSLKAWIARLYPEDSTMTGALPAQPGNAVLLAAHKLGSDVVQAARSADRTTLSGALGRIVHRRMGRLELSADEIVRSLPRVAEATQAAIGRGIEAQMENLIPGDYVFVTRELIALRDKVTAPLLDAVRQKMEKYRDAFDVKARPTKLDGQTVNDVRVKSSTDRAMLRDAMMDAFGRTNIRRDRDLSRIYDALDSDDVKVISEGDKAYLLEGIETEVFRRELMVDDAYSAGRTAFGGKQTKRAMVEGVNVGLDDRLETRVARRGVAHFFGHTVPLLINEGGGRHLKVLVNIPDKDSLLFKWGPVRKMVGAAQRWIDRSFGADLPFEAGPLTPPPMQRLIEEVRSRVGSIGDNFTREVRTLTEFYRRAKQYNPGGAALNRMAEERVSRIIETKVNQATQEALRRQDAGMGEEQAWYRISHASVADEGGQAGIGSMVTEAAAPDGGSWKNYTVENIGASVMENVWAKILSLFFEGEDYNTIRESIPRIAAGGLPAGRQSKHLNEYLPVTLENVKIVIGKVREQRTQLYGRGKGSTIFGIPTGSSDDAISQVLVAWMVGADRNQIIDDSLEALRFRHPELWVELLPSVFSREKMVRKEQLLTAQNRESVFRELVRQGIDPEVFKGAKAKYIKAGMDEKQAVKMAEAEVDRLRDDIIDEMRNQGFFDALALDPEDWSSIYGLAPMLKAGRPENAVGQIEAATRVIYSSFTPLNRKKLVGDVLQSILEEGTVIVDIQKLKSQVMQLVYNKNATARTLENAYLRLRDRANNNEILDDVDQVFLGWWERAKSLREAEALDRRERRLAARTVEPEKMVPSEGVLRAGAEAADRDISYELADIMAQNAFDTLVLPVVEEVLSNARAMGFTPGVTGASLNNIVHMVADIDPYQPALLFAGDEYVKALESLRDAAVSGKLIDNLQSLSRRDQLSKAWRDGDPLTRAKAAGQFAKDFVLEVIFTTRTMASGGMLAGGYYAVGTTVGWQEDPLFIPIPVPNLRYVGMNLLTAPLIALTTVGAANAIRAAVGPGYLTHARDVVEQVGSLTPARIQDAVGKFVNALPGKLVDAASPRPADEIVFTSRTGRRWTYAEFREAADRSNIQITRGSIEFQEAWMRDLLRTARVTSAGMEAGPFRQFLRTFDLTRTNIFQYVANSTDRAFRENMFASALKEGMPEQQAAQLARGVVLDYGRVPESIRGTLNRALLFVTFRLSMTVELIEALARDPSTFNRQLLLIRDSQQASEQYLYGADYTKSRIVLDPTTYIYDGSAGAMFYGPTHPGVSQFQELLSMGEWIAGWWAPEVDWFKDGAKAVADENLNPLLSAFIEELSNQSLRETDQGWKVPDWALAWATHNDQFGWFKNKFNIRAVTRAKDRIPGRPAFRESPDEFFVEWYFPTMGDMRKFKNYIRAAEVFGMKRATEEGTKNIMAHYDSDLIQEKRRGDVPKWAFTTGLLTPIGAPSPEEVMSQSLFEVKRAARERRPKTERQ